MKYLFGVIASAILIAASCSFAPPKSPQTLKEHPFGKRGFAVVELFTSEGCSSCPPADRVMGALAKQYAGKPVLFAGMHVDYWNRLGWKDPFSRHAFTERQNEYTRFLHSESVYTPQAIVSGHQQMIGSERNAIEAAIDKELAGGAGATLTLQTAIVNGAVHVRYNAACSNSINARIVLLLVQRKAMTAVRSGENGGRTLEHINIVRVMDYKTALSGNASISLPDGLNAGDVFIAAYVQDASDGRIIGMTQTSF